MLLWLVIISDRTQDADDESGFDKELHTATTLPLSSRLSPPQSTTSYIQVQLSTKYSDIDLLLIFCQKLLSEFDIEIVIPWCGATLMYTSH